jgi:hypothetical protein
VEVEVEHVLPRLAPVVLPEIDTHCAEVVADHRREKAGRHDGGRSFLGSDIPDVTPVRARNNENMAPGCGRLAEEADDQFVRIDDLLRQPPRNDLAE